MNAQVLSREQWVGQVIESLNASAFDARAFAETLASEECGYYQEGLTPKEALGEEMSRGM